MTILESTLRELAVLTSARNPLPGTYTLLGHTLPTVFPVEVQDDALVGLPIGYDIGATVGDETHAIVGCVVDRQQGGNDFAYALIGIDDPLPDAETYEIQTSLGNATHLTASATETGQQVLDDLGAQLAALITGGSYRLVGVTANGVTKHWLEFTGTDPFTVTGVLGSGLVALPRVSSAVNLHVLVRDRHTGLWLEARQSPILNVETSIAERVEVAGFDRVWVYPNRPAGATGEGVVALVELCELES